MAVSFPQKFLHFKFVVFAVRPLSFNSRPHADERTIGLGNAGAEDLHRPYPPPQGIRIALKRIDFKPQPEVFEPFTDELVAVALYLLAEHARIASDLSHSLKLITQRRYRHPSSVSAHAPLTQKVLHAECEPPSENLLQFPAMQFEFVNEMRGTVRQSVHDAIRVEREHSSGLVNRREQFVDVHATSFRSSASGL
jgi:hypothetical protein